MTKVKNEVKDEVVALKDKIEKAQLLLGNITDTYFRGLDPLNDKDLETIKYGFKENRLLSEIALDLLGDSFKEVQELEKLFD